MRTRKLVLTAVMAVALIGISAQADINFTVDSGATQFAYVNAFNISDDAPAADFEYNPDLSPSSFAGPVQTLGLNTDIYTANGGGTVAENAFWFTGDGSGTQLKYVEVATYQQAAGTIGETINFDFSVLSVDLPVGYQAVGFIKVLDAGASWATTQFETVDLTSGLGAKNINLIVADAGAGTEAVQAGFYITGDYVSPTTAALYGGVDVIPEPATIGLVGIFGGAMLFMRRRKFR